MYCPNRKCPDVEDSGMPGEYGSEVTTCPKCGEALVEGKPDWVKVGDSPEYDDFLPVCTLLDASMIPLVKSLLQSANIRFFIKNERLQHLYGGGTLGVGHNPISGPPIVSVDPERVKEARELLRDVNSSTDDA